MNISVSEQIYQACPRLHLGIISCDVVNTSSDEALWEEIAAEEESLTCEGMLIFVPLYPYASALVA